MGWPTKIQSISVASLAYQQTEYGLGYGRFAMCLGDLAKCCQGVGRGVKGSSNLTFFTTPKQKWFEINLKHAKTKDGRGNSRSRIIWIICWRIWKNGNRDQQWPTSKTTLDDKPKFRGNELVFIKWNFSPVVWVKMTTTGSAKGAKRFRHWWGD